MVQNAANSKGEGPKLTKGEDGKGRITLPDKEVVVKRAAQLLAVLLAVMLAAVPVQAGRMFGGKAGVQPPKWCFCARVCARFSNTPVPGTAPTGQTLAICRQINDELVYDNQVSCGCAGLPPTPDPQKPKLSPNH
jgi:hypothetical protein